jgi:hypothetical protein
MTTMTSLAHLTDTDLIGEVKALAKSERQATVPYADGGEAIATKIELRCRPHNAYESERLFGPWTPMLVRELGPDPVESSP